MNDSPAFSLLSLLKRLFFALLFVVAAILLVLYWLLGTQGGLNVALRLGQDFAPGDLHIAQAEGALLSEIRLQGVTYQQADGLAVQLEQARLHWQPWALLRNTVQLKALFLEDVQLQLPPSEAPQESTPFNIPELNIALPVRVLLEDVRLLNVRVQTGESVTEIAAVLLQAETTASATTDKLILHRLMLTSPLAAVSATGEFTLTAPNDLDLRLDWLYPLPPALQKPNSSVAQGTAHLGGQLRALQLKHQLHQPVALHLDAQATTTTNHLDWQADLSWDELRWPLQAQEPALVLSRAGQIRASGDLQSYQFSLQTDFKTTQASLPEPLAGHLQLAAHGDLDAISLDRLHSTLLQGEITATGTARWQPDVQAAVQMQAQGLDVSPFWADWPAHLRLAQQADLVFQNQTLYVNDLQVEIPQLKQQVQAQGKVALGNPEPQFALDLSWQNLGWPLQSEDLLVSSPQGTGVVSGTPSDYRLQLNTNLSGEQIPLSTWQLRGQGSQSAFYLHQLDGALLDGKLGLSGAVTWLPYIAWDFNLHSQAINPAKQWAELPGKIDASLHTQGKLNAQGLPEAQVKIQHLKGQLRDYPLNLQAELLLEGLRYQLKNLDVRSGSTRLTANAKLDDKKLQAQWKLNAPDLQTLLPQASGALQGQGEVSGSLSRPQLQATLKGEKLAFEAFKLANIDADMRLAPALKQGDETVFLDVQIADVQQAEQRLLDKLSINLDGRLSAHTLKTHVAFPVPKQGLAAKQTVDVQLAGGVFPSRQSGNEMRWRGQLQDWQLELGPFGHWALAQAAAVTFAPQAAKLEQTCLVRRTPTSARGNEGRLCTQLDWQAQGDTQVKAELKHLPLAFFKAFLPPDLRISGALSADINARLLANGELRSDSQIALSAGELRLILLDDWQTFPHQGGTLRVLINDAGLDSKLDFKFLQNSGLQASLALPGFKQADLPPAQAVQGNVLAQFKDFALLPKRVPQIENAQGEVELAMALLGTVNAPQLSGALNLKEVAMVIPDLGLKLHDFNAQVLGDGSDTLKLNSRLQSGEGELRSNGTLTLNSMTDWLADIKVQGENLQAIATDDVRGTVSPDVRIVARPGNLKISGQVHVPQADITPNIVIGGAETGQGNAPVVAMSSDVVILQSDPSTNSGQAQPAPSTSLSRNIQVDLLLSLGDEIRLDVAGFRSRLGGAVQVFLDPAQAVLRGNGAMFISQGIFRAYGQDLAIDQGFIIFNDGPLDNPGLNIKAVRTIYKDDNTPKVNKAGVHITGTAQNPRLSLFSEPPVSDGKILSYIVTGSALGSSDDGAQSLSLGGYVQPNFYVSFAFSLFDNARVFNLRYDLSEKWGLETSIGDKDSGVDISYTLGR